MLFRLPCVTLLIKCFNPVSDRAAPPVNVHACMWPQHSTAASCVRRRARPGCLVQGPWAAVPAFAALCAALSACNATGPITASVTRCLPPEAQAGGLALWNSLANIGGYFGPALYGWLKERTGRNAPGMMVRLVQACMHACTGVDCA